ncbi:hypothetical protein B296_00045391 [Ensete ventricosum]|uniref:Uncharacterized protein n=1 Tax=Ensete ventricosum TaxID=4639 RepID=A0A426XTT4_ENSVE|nr:hypothetical protein B296_00045391 [Ensete ventricosum]
MTLGSRLPASTPCPRARGTTFTPLRRGLPRASTPGVGLSRDDLDYHPPHSSASAAGNTPQASYTGGPTQLLHHVKNGPDRVTTRHQGPSHSSRGVGSITITLGLPNRTPFRLIHPILSERNYAMSPDA